MIQIKVADRIVFVDDEDLSKIEGKTLCLQNSRGNIFCKILCPNSVFLHKYILGNSSHRVKFKDGNRLNCQKENLILITEEVKRQYHKDYYQKNKEKHLEACRKWALKNPDKVKLAQERAKERYRYDENGKRREYRKMYRARPEIKAHYNAYYTNKRKEARYRFGYSKNKARAKGLNFDLTFEQYLDLISQPCYYSGESLDGFSGVGLDRIDNSKGYEVGNVLPCSGWCNKLRNNILTVEETKVAVQAILELRKSKA